MSICGARVRDESPKRGAQGSVSLELEMRVQPTRITVESRRELCDQDARKLKPLSDVAARGVDEGRTPQLR
jgi:hypothetical protein